MSSRFTIAHWMTVKEQLRAGTVGSWTAIGAGIGMAGAEARREFNLFLSSQVEIHDCGDHTNGPTRAEADELGRLAEQLPTAEAMSKTELRDHIQARREGAGYGGVYLPPEAFPIATPASAASEGTTVNDLTPFDKDNPTKPAIRAELIAVPFDGGPLPATLVNGEPHVVLRPVVEALGLDWKSQHAKLSADEAARMVLVTTQLPGDRQSREVTAVDLETFTLWLAGLQPGRVAERARPGVVAYRRSAGRALREHFFGKARQLAPSPRELAALVIAEADRADAAESQVAELQPKADLADTYLIADKATRLVRDAAKLLKMREVDLRRFLVDEALVFVKHAQCGDVMYDHYAQFAHHFTATETVVNHSWGTCAHYTLRITPRGIDLIRKRLASTSV